MHPGLFKRWIARFSIVLFYVTSGLAQFLPPNDHFTNATVLEGLSFSITATNQNATAEPNEPRYHDSAAQRSIWWKWVAPIGGQAALSATNSGRDRWRITVFVGDSLTNLTLVSSNLYSQRLPAQFTAVRGQEYKFVVDKPPVTTIATQFVLGFKVTSGKFLNLTNGLSLPLGSVPLTLTGLPTETAEVKYYAGTNLVSTSTAHPFAGSWMPGECGNYTLSAVIVLNDGTSGVSEPVSLKIRPVNDYSEEALEISPRIIETEVGGDTTFATVDPNEPFPKGGSLWWRWTPQWDGLATFTLEAGANAAVFIGATRPEFVPVVTLGDIPTRSAQVVAGTTYTIRLASSAPNYAVRLRLKLQTWRLDPATELVIPAGKIQPFRLINSELDNPISEASVFSGGEVIAQMSSPEWQFDFTRTVPGWYEFQVSGRNSAGELRETPIVKVRVTAANDHFEDALALPPTAPTVVSGELGTGSLEPWEPGWIGGESLWYKWTAPFSADVQITNGMPGGFVAMFSGTNPTNLVQHPNDWTNPWRVVEGESYYLRVTASYGATGRFEFTLVPPPMNDYLKDAIQVEGSSGQIRGSNLSSSDETWELTSQMAYRRSIWYKWAAPETGDLEIGTSKTLAFQTQVGIYAGNPNQPSIVSAPRPTSHLWSSGSGSFQPIRCRVLAGTVYYFRVSGFALEQHWPEITLDWSFNAVPNIPVNDRLEGALVLTGLTNTFTVDLSLASAEPGEPISGASCFGNGRTLWYRYTPTEDGLLRLFASEGAEVSSSFSVYVGDQIETLVNVGSGCRLPIYVPLQKGITYFLQIDGAVRWPTKLVVDLKYYLHPSNDSFQGRVKVEGAEVYYQGDTFNATKQTGEPLAATDATGKTVWLSWAAPSEGRAVVSLRSSHLIERWAVYQGSSFGSLGRLPILNDGFYARAGEVYQIQIDGAEGSYGEFEFSLILEPVVPALNDNFADSQRLVGAGFGATAWINNATTEPEEPNHLLGNQGKSLWWHWEAPVSGSISIYPTGSQVPVTIAIYTGDRLERLQLVARGTSALNLSVRGGMVYRFAVAAQSAARGMVRFSSGGLSQTSGAPVAGNILKEPSFENTALQFQHWSLSAPVNGYVNEGGGADGSTWPVLQGNGIGAIWQDFATTPGERYQFRFAAKGDNASTPVDLRVWWDETELAVFRIPAEEYSFWHWREFVVLASKATSRIRFEALSGETALDAVSVVWLNEPPSIVSPPRSISSYQGGSATFSVGVRGVEPISYQWYLNGKALTEGTNRVLFIAAVSTNHAGRYSVGVVNSFGSMESGGVTLTVLTATSPSFIVHPSSDTVTLGSFHALAADAIGSAPIRYQWYRDGIALQNQTNRHLTFPQVQTTDAGLYTVRAANYGESVTSLPAVLKVTEETRGGAIVRLMNYLPTTAVLLEAFVYDVDGRTPLGNAYVAQLYAGRTLAELRPAGQPVRFLAGHDTGVVTPTDVVLLNVAPGERGVAQLRAWDPGKGPTFETARAVGGKFGKSAIIELDFSEEPALLEGLTSFRLQAGLAEFHVGQLAAGRPVGAEIPWTLIGEPGSNYLIERATADFDWTPALVISNSTGTATFKTPRSSQQEFYRSRILD